MKTTVVACIAVLAVLLAGCASVRSLTGGTPFDRMNPKVYIVDKKHIVVDQEPITFLKGEKGRIRWHLQDPDYQFERVSGISGIRSLSGKRNDVKDCQVDKSDDRIFSCQNDNTGTETYKYSVVVIRRQDKARLTLDPTIYND
jgi:hypothetical protein